MLEFITKEQYEQMETIKLEQDNYAAKIIEIHSKKIKELEARIKKLENA